MIGLKLKKHVTRERKEVAKAEQAHTSPTLHEEHIGGSLTVSEVNETSTVEGTRSALDERKLEEIQEATEELNLNWGSSVNYGSYPKGCFASGSYIFFNSHSDGKRKRGISQMCKPTGKE